MKKLLLLVMLLLFFFIPNKAFAHVTESDGSMSISMHIDPEDDPIAGEEAAFFFDFKDKDGKFRAAECSCTIRIESEGKEIYSQNLFKDSANPSLSTPSFTYTFPQRDVYTVSIVGTPKTPHAFESFTVTYAVRVERISEDQPVQNSVRWLESYISSYANIFIVLGVLAVFIIVALVQKRKDNPKS